MLILKNDCQQNLVVKKTNFILVLLIIMMVFLFLLAKNGIYGNCLNKSELNAKLKFEEMLKEKSPANLT